MGEQAELTARFAAIARGEGDELEVALLVDELIEPNASRAACERALDGLRAALPDDQAPWAFLREAGYAGDRASYMSLDNSRMSSVLERRRGIPITLGVLLLWLARGQNRAAYGVNFPGHFLVNIDGDYIDPFALAPTDSRRLAQAADTPEGGAALAAARPVDVGLRMLNNVKGLYLRQAALDSAIAAIDCQLALKPDAAGLHAERAELWQRLGANALAREAWLEAAANASDDESRAAALQRAARLGDRDETWH